MKNTISEKTPLDPSAEYFFSRLDNPHVRRAAKTYALSVQWENPTLARQLISEINERENKDEN